MHSDVGVGDVFHLLNYHFPALGKLFFELHFQCVRALRIHLFKRSLRVIGYAIGHQRYRSQHRDQENQKYLAAECHGLAPGLRAAGLFFWVPVGAFDVIGSSESSHTSASRQSPHGDASQLCTFARTPAYSGRSTSGRMRRSSSKRRSCAKSCSGSAELAGKYAPSRKFFTKDSTPPHGG